MTDTKIRKKLEKRLAHVSEELEALDKVRTQKTEVADADHTTWAKLIKEKVDIVSELRKFK